MLQIKQLTITHTKDLRTIVQDFTFSLQDGDRAVIIGEEGNGKSTLLKLIYDPSSVSDYVEWSGEIIRNGAHLGYLAQELPPEDQSMSILEFCSQVPSFYDLSPQELYEAASAVGFTSDLFFSSQVVGTLSGGEKVKLQLARILLDQPSVLLLDEPSNDIDLQTLEWLEQFLVTCGKPVLYVSHDETLIERTATVVIHLEQLRRKTVPRCTVARIPYRQYVEERLNNLAHQEQLARKEEQDYQKQMEKYRQIYQRVDHEQRSISRQDPSTGRLLKKKMKSVKSMGRRFEREHEDCTQMPDIEDAILAAFRGDNRIPNGKTVLEFELDELRMEDRVLSRGIQLRLEGPRKACIVGRNGVGKTTLLKQIADHLLARTDLRAAYLPQNYEDGLVMDQTPVEFLARTGEKEERTRIRTYLGSMKYTADEMEHTIARLSGGQKAKLLFIQMILDGANVLILDEPTRNFSPLSNPVIRQVLRDFEGAILSISHDRNYLAEVCDPDQIYRLTESGLEVIPLSALGK